MQHITGAIQHYDWGSHTAIPTILGKGTGTAPVAEYWLGTHPRGHARLVDESPLDAWLTPQRLGKDTVAAFGAKLPFLLKLLAAERPLSLQAHPSREQAEEGYAYEEANAIPADAPERTYKDPWAKPEALVALSNFTALMGFREPRKTIDLIDRLGVKVDLDTIYGPLRHRGGSAGIAEAFFDILSHGEEHVAAVEQVVATAVTKTDEHGPLGNFARMIVEIDQFHPSDPGILAAMMLNIVTLEPGDAIFLPAGQMHAYLRGTGVEIMASSDNVVRGGLTSKHVDVDELLRVVDFSPLYPEAVPTRDEQGATHYLTPSREFQLWSLDLPDDVPVPGVGARIALVTSGEVTIAGGEVQEILRSGEAVVIGADEEGLRVSGRGQLFVAAPGVHEAAALA